MPGATYRYEPDGVTVRVIRIKCRCGEVFQADETHIGRSIRCHRCGRTLPIRLPRPTPVERRFDLRARYRSVVTALQHGRAGRTRTLVGRLAFIYLAAALLAALLLWVLGTPGGLPRSAIRRALGTAGTACRAGSCCPPAAAYACARGTGRWRVRRRLSGDGFQLDLLPSVNEVYAAPGTSGSYRSTPPTAVACPRSPAAPGRMACPHRRHPGMRTRCGRGGPATARLVSPRGRRAHLPAEPVSDRDG